MITTDLTHHWRRTDGLTSLSWTQLKCHVIDALRGWRWCDYNPETGIPGFIPKLLAGW
jgi:hypothetical protein